MKKLLISTGLVLGLASSGAFAEHLYVNNVRIDGVDVSSFSFTNGALRLTTTGGTLGVVDGNGGGNDGGGNDGGGNDGGGNDGGGNGGGNDGGGNGCTESATVACTSPFNWSRGESNTAVTIPKGKTLVTPFTTTSDPNFYGEISFEAHSSSTPATDIWISKKPTGKPADAISGRSCSMLNKGMMYEIRWSQKSSSGRCVLNPGETYYFNIKHSNASQAASTTYRTRTSR